MSGCQAKTTSTSKYRFRCAFLNLTVTARPRFATTRTAQPRPPYSSQGSSKQAAGHSIVRPNSLSFCNGGPAGSSAAGATSAGAAGVRAGGAGPAEPLGVQTLDGGPVGGCGPVVGGGMPVGSGAADASAAVRGSGSGGLGVLGSLSQPSSSESSPRTHPRAVPMALRTALAS